MSCKFIDILGCDEDDCGIHPNMNIMYGNYHFRKVEPTKFYRTPYQTCWFVSCLQLLSCVDWSTEIRNYVNDHSDKLFSKIMRLVLAARFDCGKGIFTTKGHFITTKYC